MFPVPYWVGVGGGEWEMPVGREVNSVERALRQDLRACLLYTSDAADDWLVV